MSMSDDNHWHLDKKVPIALIVTLLCQFAAGVWFAGKMSQRQDEQERRITVMEQQNVGGRLGALEGQLSDVKAGLNRIDAKLDRLIEKGARP